VPLRGFDLELEERAAARLVREHLAQLDLTVGIEQQPSRPLAEFLDLPQRSGEQLAELVLA
jgi:hypothetical protein